MLLHELCDNGFSPAVPLCRASSLVGHTPGVYVVALTSPTPDFVSESVGGWFKGRCPSVSIDALRTKWVPGTEVLYVGRASNLRRRIGQLVRFGHGQAVGHWGGRYLWQLGAHADFVVTWRSDADPVAAETELLAQFEDRFGALPYANLARGTQRLPIHTP